MNLEEMKSQWAVLSVEMQKQKKLTDEMIVKMTKTDYRNKINKLILQEAAGAIGCYAAVFYIVSGFERLDTWYIRICGFISIAILISLPVLSLRSIHRMKHLNISNNNYKETLSAHSKAAIHFVSVQKINFIAGALLLVMILPVMAQLIGGRNVFLENRLWLWYAVGFPFFYLFSKKVFNSYMKTAADARILLEELKN